MALKQMLLELGWGVDLHGRDYSKAARRAVENAIGHNSLNFIRSVGSGKPQDMHIKVIVAVPQPEAVKEEPVLAALPFGHKTLEVVPGGLELPAENGRDVYIIANAAVIISLDLP